MTETQKILAVIQEKYLKHFINQFISVDDYGFDQQFKLNSSFHQLSYECLIAYFNLQSFYVDACLVYADLNFYFQSLIFTQLNLSILNYCLSCSVSCCLKLLIRHQLINLWSIFKLFIIEMMQLKTHFSYFQVFLLVL